MTELCTKCGGNLSAPWRFCPACGAAVEAHEQEKELPAKAEKAPMRGGFGGLFLGVIVAPMCIIVGTMLCLTGLGAFLGIPMILGGIAAPLLGPMIVIGEPKGECPWCGTKLSNVFNSASFECHSCGKQIVTEHRKFIKAA